ncbi:DUF3311 domain-containing protein [Sphaerisporangium sp. NBC_01403]|uniref:DUF3311 domain-containing protein n=1 Tax=Sphaerisporangium sp. NBC_01403 TaxID=2903599 RepID=UPI0032535240
MIATALLVAPFVALLWVDSYARPDPSLFGVPFFYWYQLLWVPLSSGATWCAYLLMTPAGSPGAEARRRTRSGGGLR